MDFKKNNKSTLHPLLELTENLYDKLDAKKNVVNIAIERHTKIIRFRESFHTCTKIKILWHRIFSSKMVL